MTPNKVLANNFAEYLQSVVKINTLERITSDLDKELADSQNILDEIKNMYQSIPDSDIETDTSNGLRHTDVLNFLQAEPTQVLLPDMVDNAMDVNLDDVIASMKVYAEGLKKKIIVTESQLVQKRIMGSLELDQYASSLDQLGKRLANIKINKRDEVILRNEELEIKLTQLCEDVNSFTQMVKAKTALSESNKNWIPLQDSNALCYDSIINKLLSGINEVSYLLQNKN